MNDVKKAFQQIQDLGILDQVSERITEAAHVSAKTLREKNAQGDEFTVPFVNIVTNEAVKQAVYISLLINANPDLFKSDKESN